MPTSRIFTQTLIFLPVFIVAIVAAVSGVAAAIGHPDTEPKASQGGEAKPAPFALVEMYTSQGCSSCPPADALLTKTVSGAVDGHPVLGLAFHVDYWDHLGWKDRFADPAYSARQRARASAMGVADLYTPQ
ncbi:MAG: DUF1223 domain-containing protein, partial [Planctomycetota bacterium]|nr:DUF1223 domain-containing protein [Planctomycetota bacterium]